MHNTFNLRQEQKNFKINAIIHAHSRLKRHVRDYAKFALITEKAYLGMLLEIVWTAQKINEKN